MRYIGRSYSLHKTQEDNIACKQYACDLGTALTESLTLCVVVYYGFPNAVHHHRVFIIIHIILDASCGMPLDIISTLLM